MKSKHAKKHSFIFVLMIAASLPVLAKNIYVDASAGNDSYSYTANDASHPFKTVQRALDLVLAGDIILVNPGIYKQNLTWKISGTNALPVILQKNGSGTVYLKSADASAAAILDIPNIQNIIIDGLYFTRDNVKNDCQGIQITSSGNAASKNIEVRNCTFSGINWNTNPNIKPTTSQNSQPLIAYGRSSVAINNIYVHNCEFANNITGQSEVCSMNANIDGFTITNNSLHDNTNIAVDAIGHEGENSNVNIDQARNGVIANNVFFNNQSPYSEGASIYVDGGKSITIEKNLIYNGDYGIEISSENNPSSFAFETQDITVRNNIIYNCRSVGLKIGAFKGIIQGCLVTGNTSFYNNRGGYRDGDVNHQSKKFSPWAELVIDNMQDVTIENNIFYSRGGGSNAAMLNSDGSSTLTNVNINYNLWYNKSSATGSALTFQYNNGANHNYTSWSNYQSSNVLNFDKQSKYGDPKFVNEGISGSNVVNPDLHIQSGSPAIASGDPSSVISDVRGAAGTTDYFGNNRKTGTIDIGAHELASGKGGSLVIKTNTGNQTVSIYPNPVEDNLQVTGLKTGDYLICLYDFSGKKKMNKKLHAENNLQLNAGNLSAGAYVLTINGQGMSYTFKIVKK